MSVITATWRQKWEDHSLRQPHAKCGRPYLKDKLRQKGLRAWLKYLPSKGKALSSNTSTTKKKKNQDFSGWVTL
jgi:arsenate reductase-like glutaredoxin family protein